MHVGIIAIAATISSVGAYSGQTYDLWDGDGLSQGIIERDLLDLDASKWVAPYAGLKKRDNAQGACVAEPALFSRQGEVYSFSYKKIQSLINNPRPNQQNLVPAYKILLKAIIDVEASVKTNINKRRIEDDPKFKPVAIPTSVADLDSSKQKHFMYGRDADADPGFVDAEDFAQGLYKRDQFNLHTREALPEAYPYVVHQEDQAQSSTPPKSAVRDVYALSKDQQNQCHAEARKAHKKCESAARGANAEALGNNRGGIVRPEDNKQNGGTQATGNDRSNVNPQRSNQYKQGSQNSNYNTPSFNNIPVRQGGKFDDRPQFTTGKYDNRAQFTSDSQNKQRTVPTTNDNTAVSPKSSKRDVFDENYLFGLDEREVDEYEALFEPEMSF